MGLRDRGKRLKGKEAKPRAAPKAPIVEAPAATPREAPAKRPPPRERPAPREEPAEETPVSRGTEGLAVPSRSDSDAMTVPKASAPVAEPEQRDAQTTVPARPAPKAAPAPSTEQLSVSDLLPVTDPGAATPVTEDAPVDTQALTRPTPQITTVDFTARFSATGDVYTIGAANLKLQLAEIMGANMVNVVLSGGMNDLSLALTKDAPVEKTYELADGASVNVLLKYTGKNLSGSAMEVAGAVKGSATKLAQTVGRATGAARTMISGAPSKLRFLPSIAIMALGAATSVCSFAVAGMKSLGTAGQYGLALAGVATVFIAGWSVIERIRYNQRIR